MSGRRIYRGERFSIRLLDFPTGFRYWAFERRTGADDTVGLDPNGYNTETEAREAVRLAEEG